MKKVGKDLNVLFFLIGIGLIFSLTIPTTVTWDGYYYLASGLSLFTDSFPRQYFIMKEPAYPFLIFLSHRLGDTLIWLTILQSLLISFGVWRLCIVFMEEINLKKRTVIILGTLSLTTFIGFAAAVMQQSLIFFVLSLSVSFLRIKPRNAKFCWFLLGALSTATGIAIGMILGFSLLAYVFLEKKGKKRIKEFAWAFVGIAVFAIPWFTFTFSLDLSKQDYPTCRTSFCLNGFDPEWSERRKMEQRIMAVPSLLFLSKESYFGVGLESSLAQEATTYGIPVFSGSDNCLRKGPGPKFLNSKISLLTNHYCIPDKLLKIRSWYDSMLFFMFPLFGLIFIYWFIQSIFRDAMISRGVLIVPVVLFLLYALTGAGISRYNVLLQTMGPFYVFALFKKFRLQQAQIKENN